MSEKRLLLADADSQAGEDFRQALGASWVVTSATNGSSALAEMHKHPCSVVVADLNLPEIEGAELLNRIRKKYPRTIRFISATDADKQRVMKTARGAHQFLTKPYDLATLKDTVERALATDVWVASDKLRELIAKIRTLPTVPTLYLEIVTALRSPSATTEQIGGIIAKDMAMTAKLLQLLNSACFGLTRQITDPAEAVGILGFETVKSMVMTIKLLNQYDKMKSLTVSVDKLWQHSTDVARTARQLALLETGDRALAELAFTSGLMHDLGKVVLASNFDDQYHGALLLGAKQSLPAWEVERDVFGANHGEVGAYLLGLWGLPLAVLEATALHHSPSRSASRAFTPLTAVHVANVLERELNPDELGMAPAELDEEYLAESGLLERVGTWREAVKSQEFDKKGAPKPTPSGLAMKTTPDDPSPREKTPLPVTKSESESVPAAGQRKWMLGGGIAVAGFALLAVAGLAIQLQPKLQPQSPKSQTEKLGPMPRRVEPRPAVPPLGGPQVVGAPSPDAEAARPAENTVEKSPETAVGPLQIRARTETVVPAPVGDSAPPPVIIPSTKPPTKDLPLSEFKLQGIVYSAGNPSAIINGTNVRVNEKVLGARVVTITATNVTLESQGERRTLTLKVK